MENSESPQELANKLVLCTGVNKDSNGKDSCARHYPSPLVEIYSLVERVRRGVIMSKDDHVMKFLVHQTEKHHSFFGGCYEFFLILMNKLHP